MKVCKICNIEKNEKEFEKNRRQCKKCRSHKKINVNCIHNKRKSRCKDCSSSYCIHKIFKPRCKEGNGNAFCIHNTRKSNCRICFPNSNSFCKNCKEVLAFKRTNFLCRNCNPNAWHSKGETEIIKILTENNIEFQREFIFKNQPKEIKLCRYDFYIPCSNTIIEYHGIQHYKFNIHFHKNNDDFIKRLYLDILKKEFCINNCINFIEIKYTDDIKKTLEIENVI